MRKLLCTLLIVVFTITVLKPSEARAEMPIKTKAFVTIVGYGAAGGALLGAASLAFGTSTRAVAQGASLGLYAGIIFGTYVLLSHNNRNYGNYDDGSSPYQQSSDIYGDGYKEEEGGAQEGDQSGSNFFNRIETLTQKFGNNKGGKLPPLKLNLVQFEF